MRIPHCCIFYFDFDPPIRVCCRGRSDSSVPPEGWTGIFSGRCQHDSSVFVGDFTVKEKDPSECYHAQTETWQTQTWRQSLDSSERWGGPCVALRSHLGPKTRLYLFPSLTKLGKPKLLQQRILGFLLWLQPLKLQKTTFVLKSLSFSYRSLSATDILFPWSQWSRSDPVEWQHLTLDTPLCQSFRSHLHRSPCCLSSRGKMRAEGSFGGAAISWRVFSSGGHGVWRGTDFTA